MFRKQPSKPDNPSGFTLIELIIVMGLIAFLSSIVLITVAGFITRAREAATRTTLLKIDRLVETRLEAYDRFIHIADKRSGFLQPPEYVIYNSPEWQLFTGTGAFANNADPNYAVFLARKKFIRSHFAQRFSDWDFDGTPGADAPFNSIPASHNPDTESAEMLYHFLHKGVLFGAPPVGEGDFLASEVGDTDNDGFPEFIDSWGNPIRFYLWPTRLIRPNFPPGSPQTAVVPPGDVFVDPAGNPNQKNHNYILFLMNSLPEDTILRVDPDDILGINSNPAGGPNKLTATTFENAFHTMNTWHRPLIMSAGEDGRLGLFEPNDNANKGNLAQFPDFSLPANAESYGDLQDNMCNWYLRPGGQ